MPKSPEAEQARDRLQQCHRALQELGASGSPPQIFFDRFLTIVGKTLAARGGLFWMLDENETLGIAAYTDLADTGLLEDKALLSVLQRHVRDVILDDKPAILSSDDHVELPPQFLHLICPVRAVGKPAGAVHLLLRTQVKPEARAGYLQFLERMVLHSTAYLEHRHSLTTATDPTNYAKQMQRVLLQLQRRPELKDVASIAVNDGQKLLGCDRVAIAIRRGKKVEIQTVSGQDSVNRRADNVRAMADLAKAVINSGDALTYTGTLENLAPQLEEPLAKYVHLSGSRMFLALPLYEPEAETTVDPTDPTQRDERKHRIPFAVLLVDQFRDSHPAPDLIERAGDLSEHIAASLYNARWRERIFLLPMWQTIGKTKEWFRGRKLWKTLAILGAASLLIACLALVPWNYRVVGEGRLMPVVRQRVYAPWDGEVMQILVDSGDRVTAGQTLILINNDELNAELVGTRNRRLEKIKQIESLLAEIDSSIRRGDRDEEITLRGRLEETRLEIDSLEDEIRILAERVTALNVTAPIDGVVATFQLDDILAGRPVARGDMLLEVMDESGPWRLELEVPEHRMGHILRAINAENSEKLPVEFVLATATETSFQAELEKLGTKAGISEESGSIVEVHARPDRDEIPNRRIGAEVSAKIDCGPKSLGYVLFGDVVEFVQRYFWF